MIGSILIRLYRSFVPRVMSWLRPVSAPYRSLEKKNPLVAGGALEGGVWFHAASAGELESMAPLVEKSLAARRPTSVTVFSPSALGRLATLEERWKASFNEVPLATGASPPEGTWKRALKDSQTAVFVTVKYEAWPDLWASLGELGIPLLLIGAQSRPSLGRMGWAFRVAGLPLPRILAFLSDEGEDEAGLRRDLPEARIQFAGDPRWDRVRHRLVEGSPRVKCLRMATRELRDGKREGIIGSAWPQDLERVLGPWASRKDEFLWIVPHEVTSDRLKGLVAVVQRVLPREEILFSSRIQDESLDSKRSGRIVIVDEVGFLAELYGHSTWAFVGGGFGAGVHSTLEPATAGLPIASGPARVNGFSETRSLRRSSQLTIIHDSTEFDSWLDRVEHLKSTQGKLWKADVERQYGATDRIWCEVLSAAPAAFPENSRVKTEPDSP